MVKEFTITDTTSERSTIVIDITVNDDGSLKILDFSFGPAADECFWDGADVEHWIDVPAESTCKLSSKLFGAEVQDPAGSVARHLAAEFRDDTCALRKIREFLESEDIPFEEEMWP